MLVELSVLLSWFWSMIQLVQNHHFNRTQSVHSWKNQLFLTDKSVIHYMMSDWRWFNICKLAATEWKHTLWHWYRYCSNAVCMSEDSTSFFNIIFPLSLWPFFLKHYLHKSSGIFQTMGEVILTSSRWPKHSKNKQKKTTNPV